MRIEHLQYLLEIEKQRSISAAAQSLYLGQTTLSAIVKSLEQELGFSVFQRTHNGVQTTPEGEEALSLIWEISCRYEEIKQLSSHSSTLSQSIPVILSPTINSALALPLSSAFVSHGLHGALDFHVVAGENVGPMIIKNDGNIGLTYFLDQSLEEYRLIASRYQIQIDILLEDQFYVVVSRDHPLANHDSLCPDKMRSLHFATLSHYSSNDSSIPHFVTSGPENHYTTFSDIGLIKRAILGQNMVGILTGYALHCNNSVDNSLLKAFKLSDIEQSNQLNLCLIHRADSNLTLQEKFVLQYIKELFQQQATLLSK